MTLRAVVYARVSTVRQAAGELSIPDQIAQCTAYAEAKDWTVVKTFTDAGYSATSADRPDFQAMIAEACARSKPFDVVLVHSQSRFARNTMDLLSYERRLERAGVGFVSITQDFGDTEAAPLMRTIFGAYDEHQSRETSKHVKRSMAENARQGFWNGAQPPFGYRTYVAERRGAKDKKKLGIDPAEAEIVRRIFRMHVCGENGSGPMGMKRIADRLSAERQTNRQGKPFRIQFIQKILRNEAYVGRHINNRRDTKNDRIRPPEEWIVVPVPPIVCERLFEIVQDKLDRQHPMKTAPRIVTSDVLLTGLASCAQCGAPMRIQTGKSGRYRYYKCSKRADHGGAACSGCSIPEAALDGAVMDVLVNKILAPARLSALKQGDRPIARSEQARFFLPWSRACMRAVRAWPRASTPPDASFGKSTKRSDPSGTPSRTAISIWIRASRRASKRVRRNATNSCGRSQGSKRSATRR